MSKEEKKIVFAPQDKIRALRPWIDQILEAIGYGRAWVSNESCLGDFPLEDEDYEQLSELLGFLVEGKDYLVDVAQRLKEVTERN